MKKQLQKVLSLVLIVVCLLGAFAPAAGAASKVSSLKFNGTPLGGKSNYIYVKTNDTEKSKSVKLTFDKGKIKTALGADEMYKYMVKTVEARAAYEIKISYWNGTKWVQETSYDVYNKSSKTVTLNRKNTDYRIQVYQWRTSTTLTSYINKGVVYCSSVSTYIDNPYWSTLPTFKVSSATRAQIYNGKTH